MKKIRKVLIVGGGTAGWLTAAYLARTLGVPSPADADADGSDSDSDSGSGSGSDSDGDGGIRITLVESSEIGIIGVGEGSFPSLRGTLAAIGIDEARFLRECNATFKQGIRFAHWVRPPGGEGHRDSGSRAGSAAAAAYFHPFNTPSQRQGGPDLLPYWLLGDAGAGAPFADSVSLQSAVVDACRGPKRLGDGDFTGPMNYAYHFDAGKFATLLARHARSLGVHHVLDTVEHVELSADGDIAAVLCRGAGRLEADLFVDCSGFRAALIGGALGSAFRSVADTLFVDRALAVQVPYLRPDAPIASATISTAHAAGWTWDIGLQQRRGVGYVYSSAHTSDASAEQVLRQQAGSAAEGLTPRQLKLQVGYRERQWVRNCVAIGLSAGFVEPLEASGIGLVETAAYLLAHRFPFDGNMAAAAEGFNRFMRERFERVVDFVKLHYALNQREDSDFWHDNRQRRSLPDSLQQRLDMWRCRPPHRLDFITDIEMYPPSSWSYVLYGMEFAPDADALHALRRAHPRRAEARLEFDNLRRVARHALADLPDHRALVQQLCRRGAPAVQQLCRHGAPAESAAVTPR